MREIFINDLNLLINIFRANNKFIKTCHKIFYLKIIPKISSYDKMLIQ